MDSEMETSSLSLSLYCSIHFLCPCLETEYRHHFENNFFFPHHLKDAHFVFFLPHRQMCL